jgi:hypothetical protein
MTDCRTHVELGYWIMDVFYGHPVITRIIIIII